VFVGNAAKNSIFVPKETLKVDLVLTLGVNFILMFK
jgi:hypothetical protein